jgi:hypothetical protein
MAVSISSGAGVEGFRNPTFKYETLLIKKRGLDGGNPTTEAIDHNPRDVPQPNAD